MMNDEIKQLLQLSRTERAVDPAKPWQDDQLERKVVADKLTRIIDGESGPLTISVHGPWGTGKTFLLKRWRQQLENDKFKCIYFNAWSDDFHGEPLVAMIGQLAESLEDDKYEKFISSIKELAVPLIGHVADLHIGVPVAGAIQKLQEITNKKMDAYYKQAATKQELSEKLEDMAREVRTETGKPLVFIIDELDRCRPTFAVELLERVKHIFDIPNIIFVFGVNRIELCKAVESVYGDIDSDTYLRRFFDLNFILPNFDAEKFCSYLAAEYKLHTYFEKTSNGFNNHQRAYSNLVKGLTMFVRFMGLSLRDIDNCLKATVLVGKNLDVNSQIFMVAIVPLIILRLKNQECYEKFMRGECFPGEVMNYLDGKVPKSSWGDSDVNRIMNLIEYYLLRTESKNPDAPKSLEKVDDEVRLLSKGEPSQIDGYFSNRAQSENNRRDFLVDMFLKNSGSREYTLADPDYFFYLIDLANIEHP